MQSVRSRFLSKHSRLAAALIQPVLSVFLLSVLLLPSAQARSYGQLNEDPRSLREVAFEHYIENDLSTALDFYQKAVDRAVKEYGADSSFVGDLYFEMGVLAFDAGWFQKAEDYLTKAVQQNSNSIVAKVKLAELLQVRNRPDLALGQINQALAKKRNSPEARQALVVWLIKQRNAAGAVHESYIMSQALQHAPVPMPKYGDGSKLASASLPPAQPVVMITPAKPAAAPDHIKGIMSTIFQSTKGKPEPAKPPEAKKPEAKKPPEKKPEPKKAPPVKAIERPKKTTVKAKPEKKPDKKVPAVPAVKPEVVEPVVSGEGIKATMGVLKTTAKVRNEKKTETERAKPQPSENEPKQQEEKPEPRQEAPPPQPPMQFFNPIKAPPPAKHPARGLVPPPPPMVPVFPVMGQPPPMMMQPPPVKKRPPVAKPKPVEAEPEHAKPESSSPPPSSSGGNEESSDFLLDWGNVKSKKKSR